MPTNIGLNQLWIGRDLPARIALPVSLSAVPTALAALYATIVFGDRCRELECLGMVAFWAALAGAILALAPGLLLLRAHARTRAGRFGRGALAAFGTLGLAVAWCILFGTRSHWL